MQDQTRGQEVPVARVRRRRAVGLATVVLATTALYGGVNDFHKAFRSAHGGATVVALANVSSTPRLSAAVRARARLALRPTPVDAETVAATLALLVLAASSLPKGSPARRQLASDAKRLRLELDRLDLAAT